MLKYYFYATYEMFYLKKACRFTYFINCGAFEGRIKVEGEDIDAPKKWHAFCKNTNKSMQFIIIDVYLWTN